jgi:hypothetical protein
MNISEYMSSIGKKGGQTRAKNQTAAERTRLARKAAKASWKNRKKKPS